MRDELFSSELIDIAGIPIVRVCGEIDLYNVSEFRKALEAGIELGTPALVVDLSGISYIDSAGLSILLLAYKSLALRNAHLHVVADPGRPGVRRVLEITRVDSFIKVSDTVDQILNELRYSPAV